MLLTPLVSIFLLALYDLLCSFLQGTEGAPNSNIHLICSSFLGPEMMEHMKSHESPSDHLKRLSNLLELLDAQALEDRMHGRDTFEQPALDLSPPDTNVPKVASGFYQQLVDDYLSRCSREEFDNFFGCSTNWGDDHSDDENREFIDAGGAAAGWDESTAFFFANNFLD